MTTRPFLHPYLVSAFPALFLLDRNFGELPAGEAALLLAGTLALCALLLAVARLLRLDDHRRAIAVTILLAGFFAYGSAYDTLQGWLPQSNPLVHHRVLLPLGVLVTITVAFAAARAARRSTTVTSFLNAFAICLVLIPLVGLGHQWLLERRALGELRASPLFEGADLPGVADRPDIYYLVLDGYASGRTLETLYDTSNDSFLRLLDSLGYSIADRSFSNYAHTYLSLASSLNMAYLDRIATADWSKKTKRNVVYQRVRRSHLVGLLRQAGYRYVHFDSGWSVTGSSPLAQLSVGCGLSSEAVGTFLQMSGLRPFRHPLDLLLRDYRQRLDCTFRELAAMPGVAGPKLIFAHIVLPHPPFLFTRDGSATEGTLRYSTDWSPRSAYVEQLLFLNSKLADLATTLRRQAGDSIVVLQSDHGPASTLGADSWREPSDENILERLGILHAIYIPETIRNDVYPSMSPVNTFRVILNSALGTELKLLPDRHFFTSGDDPAGLLDVTRRVDALRDGVPAG